MIRFLHLADVHLGASLSGFGELAPVRRDQVREAFRQLPELAREYEVDAVLVAGDLFDSPEPSVADRQMAAELFRLLDEAGRRVFVVPGNHDPITVRPNPYREPLGPAHVFTSPAFTTARVETERGTLRVHGLAFDPAQCDDPLATLGTPDEAGVDVVLLHASLRMSDHWEPGANTLCPEEADLRALGVDYVALGDYHRPRLPEDFGDGLVACYPGSFSAVKRSEKGPRGVVVVQVEPGGPVRATHVPTSIPWIAEPDPIEVSGMEDHQAILDAVAECVPEGAVPRLTLTGSPAFAIDVEKLEAGLQERYGFARVKDESWYFDSARLDDLAERDTVAGHLVRLARRRVAESDSDDERRALEDALRLSLAALEVE